VRLLGIFIGLAVLFLVSFLIWGGSLEEMFSQANTVAWLEGYGAWAWAAGTVLLMLDLLLPIPGTVVMSALGFVYGPVLGGLVASLGSFLSGAFGYTVCRMLGRRGARRILGEEGLEKGERIFTNMGGWLVVLSRWLPLFPEVVACMAGLARMPARSFYIALACGSVPLGFVFAAVGSAGVEHPALALVLSAVLPPLLWLAVRPFFRARAGLDEA
jgi:uncharacterized membrane protein YdjX (TVP38/TMEM64 family)